MSILRYMLVLVVAAFLGLSACSTSSSTSPTDDSSKNNNTDSSLSTEALNTILRSGTWYVSTFSEKSEDKTSKFEDLSFVFNADGTLSITDIKSKSVETGSWSYTPAVTYYGSSSKAAISINAGSNNPHRLLSGKWNFISASTSLIAVDSPEVEQQVHLKFSKR